MAPRGSFISSATLLLLFSSSVCHGLLVETCQQLQVAFNLTQAQDVVVEIHPLQDIDCVDFTTMSMDSYSLTVESSENLDNYGGGSASLYQIRFEVKNGAKLTWETNVEFHGTYTGPDVDGGGVFVGEGSAVRFLNDLEMIKVGVESSPASSVISRKYLYERKGGCVYSDGFFRVDGEATFTRCYNWGGGDTANGPGGALYVGEKGSVMFEGALKIFKVTLGSFYGDDGAGIHNRGEVIIKGDAFFDTLHARNGGAIYNAAGAHFRFQNQATAVFIHCYFESDYDLNYVGGALYNEGYLAFSGPALFYETSNPSVFVSSEGETVFSEDSVFWYTYSDESSLPAVLVETGGEVVVPGSVVFIGYDDAGCGMVYYDDFDNCECRTSRSDDDATC